MHQSHIKLMHVILGLEPIHHQTIAASKVAVHSLFIESPKINLSFACFVACHKRRKIYWPCHTPLHFCFFHTHNPHMKFNHLGKGSASLEALTRTLTF